MKHTLADIRENLPHVGCDNETALEMCAEIERLRKGNAQLVAALRFYAEPGRYHGPNQRAVEGDKFTAMDAPYMQDVTRDRGDIARATLKSAEEK